MTSRKFTDKSGYIWTVGYDPDREGFYARREGGSVHIGQWKGVNLTHLKFRLANYGAELDYQMIEQLERDRDRAHSVLGRLIRGFRRG